MITQASGAFAQDFAGDGSFPVTILTPYPFVADEMSLPTVMINPQGSDGSREIEIEGEISKRITPDLGLTLSHQWERLQPEGMPAVSGLGGTLNAELDYQLFVDAPHQAAALVGINTGFGNTGRVQALDAPDFTTVSPVIVLGKAFGDLPESARWLQPLAITGTVSFNFPTKTQSTSCPDCLNPNKFNFGFATQYSLGYLQNHVKDLGLSAPFDRLVPLVEFSFSTAVNRGQGGQTVGTIQPGVIWFGPYVQIGAEAIVPASGLTGHGYGGVLQLHFYLENLFPSSIGRPLFR
jgi:hypothetical protein